MDKGQAGVVVADLGARLGIDGLALDERGSATLAIDDGEVIVTLGYNPGAGTIDLLACLDEVEPSGAQLGRLLAANFGWTMTEGAAFALDPASGALVLQRRCSADEIGRRGLSSILEGFVAIVAAWAKRLAAAPATGSDDAADGEVDAFHPSQASTMVLRA
jgi:hypothetical protein